MAHLFICPNCGNRTSAQDRQQGFRNVPKGCSKCGFGFLFELLDDYYPAPKASPSTAGRTTSARCSSGGCGSSASR
jgi:hypothetical protein